MIKLIAVVGGLLGGWAVERLFPSAEVGPAFVTATTLGALIAGRFLGDLASLALGGARSPAADVAAPEIIGR